MNDLVLKPTYWASVSGGKDSLYMLKLILENPSRYPLNGVVHFELDIDYPFIKNVVEYMESECKKAHIPFLRIKPEKTWNELYNKNHFPTRIARWCNNHYKLNAKRQLEKVMKDLGQKVYFYIGYASNEYERTLKNKSKNNIYPLIENKVNEGYILEWAKTVSLFNNFYLTNRRCGCMYCPLASYITFAYLYKYYPEKFAFMIDKMKETEAIREKELGRPFSCISSNPKYNAFYLENIIKAKWLPILETREQYELKRLEMKRERL